MTDNKAPIDPINDALLFLAGRCDYATKKDDVGFNAFDAGYGHQMADWVAAGMQLDESNRNHVIRMLQKYKRQLDSAGITLPKPTSDPDEKRLLVGIEGDRIYLKFPSIPPETTRNALKAIPGWKFHYDRGDKPWSVPLSAGNARSVEQITGVHVEVADAPDVRVTELTSPPVQQDRKPALTIEVSGADIIMRFPEPSGRKALVAKAKAIVNGEWKWQPTDDGTPWTCRIPARFLIRIVEAFPDAVLDDEAKRIVENQTALATMSGKANGVDLKIDGLRGEPYDFQNVGFAFIERAGGRAIVADEMGLGKTIETMMYLQAHPELRPAVIVVPAGIKTNWKREIARWMSDRCSTHVISGTKPYPLAAAGVHDIFIINWDILSKWVDAILAIKPAVLIGDEAHAIKNYSGPQSNKSPQRAKAFVTLAKKTPHVIALTGTPVTNRPRELYPLLYSIDPQSWPSFWKYAKRYCNLIETRFGVDMSGASNLDELHTIIKPYVIRRKKSDVLKDLPEKRRVNVIVEFDPQARAKYNDHVWAAISKAAGEPEEALVEIEAAKQAAAFGKLDAVIEWIENFLEGDEKLTVFAWHVKVVDAIYAHFKDRAVMIQGGVSLEKRQEAIDRFQTDDSVRLFVGNIQAAGVGITLTAASNAAFVEYAWTPGDMQQAEDRIHRIGQTQSVTIWNIIAEDTIEEDIIELLDEKRKIIDVIHEGKAGAAGFGMMNQLVARLQTRMEATNENR